MGALVRAESFLGEGVTQSNGAAHGRHGLVQLRVRSKCAVGV